MTGRLRSLVPRGAAILVALLLALPLGTPELRTLALLVVLGGLGWLIAGTVTRAVESGAPWDALDRAVLAGALAVLVGASVSGLVQAIPGRPEAFWAPALLVLAMVVAVIRCHSGPTRLERTVLIQAVVLVMVAAPLRFVGLGFSEFQGDEVAILHRAAALVQGVDQAWLAHRKGPGEILVAVLFGQTVGRVTELDTRIPFTVISIVSVLGIFAAGRAMFSTRAGFIAALLWAINGYAIGLGRIVQYHSVVILLAGVALLCAWRGHTSEGAPRRRLLSLALILLAAAAVFGFNVLTLGLPAMIVIAASLIGRLPRPGRLGWTTIGCVAAVVAVFAVYGVLQRAQFERYLAWRLGQGQPFNNLDIFGGLTIVYTGLPYLALTVGVWLVACLAPSLTQPRPVNARTLAAAVTLGGLLVLLGRGGQPTWLAMAIWAGLLAQLVTRTPDLARTSVMLGALLPFGMYAFLVQQTGTHWFEVFPAALFSVGVAVSGALGRLSRRVMLVTAPILGLLVIALGVYPAFQFLPVWPSAAQLPGASVYRPSARPPRQWGDFGMPHLDGWKAIAVLHSQGLLPLPYSSNEDPEVTRWYLPLAERCSPGNRAFVLVRSVSQPRRRPPGSVVWRLRAGDRERAVILDREAAPEGARVITAERSISWFDERWATLERPLNAPQVACPRPMPPVWTLN